MAKSAKRRHHAERLYQKAIRELKHCNPARIPKISFGKTFKQDVWDCGIPQCHICHNYKISERKKFRLESRKLERVIEVE